MINAPQYWFPAKTYGWGWGLPLTWQGWVVLATYVAVLVAAAFFIDVNKRPVVYSAIVLAASAVLVGICWVKGEPTHWRWGD